MDGAVDDSPQLERLARLSRGCSRGRDQVILRGTIAAGLFLASILDAYQRVEGAAFTAGNVVVLIPQGTTSAATAISLVEYSPVGVAVQTVSVAGACTMSASATSEGKLALSYDGARVSWGCYACAAGTTSVATVGLAGVVSSLRPRFI